MVQLTLLCARKLYCLPRMVGLLRELQKSRTVIPAQCIGGCTDSYMKDWQVFNKSQQEDREKYMILIMK